MRESTDITFRHIEAEFIQVAVVFKSGEILKSLRVTRSLNRRFMEKRSLQAEPVCQCRDTFNNIYYLRREKKCNPNLFSTLMSNFTVLLRSGKPFE